MAYTVRPLQGAQSSGLLESSQSILRACCPHLHMTASADKIELLRWTNMQTTIMTCSVMFLQWLNGEQKTKQPIDTAAVMRISNVFIVATIVTFMLAKKDMTGAQAGFLLSFASEINTTIQFLIIRVRSYEENGVSLERIAEYRALEPEERQDWQDGESKPAWTASTWPEHGNITVKDLSASYGQDMPEILHKVAFDVGAGEKVGIVGATGGGKSTLAKTFLRFVDITNGVINVDNQGGSGDSYATDARYCQNATQPSQIQYRHHCSRSHLAEWDIALELGY